MSAKQKMNFFLQQLADACCSGNKRAAAKWLRFYKGAVERSGASPMERAILIGTAEDNYDAWMAGAV